MRTPARGDVWMVKLDPVRGVEQGSDQQGNDRPCLVVSANRFNYSGAELAVILPITSKEKNISWWVKVEPPEGGLNRPSFIMCEQIRAIDFEERLTRQLGSVEDETLRKVEDLLKILLEIYV